MKGELKELKPITQVDHDAMLARVERWVAARRADETMKLAGVAIVSVYTNGCVATSYDHGRSLWTLLGALKELEWRMQKEAE